MSDRVRLERTEGVATLIFDLPERMNVLDRTAWEALARIVEELSSDDSVRCVAFRGMGARAFSAGSDISTFPEQRNTPEAVAEYAGAINAALRAIWDCPHPTLALVRGVCVGGGLEITACCDVRICSAGSRFGAPINRLGLTMSHAELTPLYRTLGASTVLALLLEGSLFGADHAYRVGLVHRVIPADEFNTEATATAGRIAAGAPLVNRWHKKFIRQLQSDADLGDEDIAEGYAAFETEDYREGVRAFLEKRDPEFRGE